MKILAFECSSPEASMAMITDGEVVAEVQWDIGARRQHRLFNEMDVLIEQAGIALSEVDAFAVGRGPGNFTGMRVSLATAQAMALPRGLPCLSLSSGSALAAQWLTEHPGPLAVVGDARRGQCWYGTFDSAPTPGVEADWALCPYENLVSRLPLGCTVISSEMDRVKKAIPGIYEAGLHVQKQNVYPVASRIGLWAASLLSTGQAGEPAEPLYMHPAL